MKKFLLTLTMLLCILLPLSAACADEMVDACPYCGNTDLKWYSMFSEDGEDIHHQACFSCNSIVGGFELCTLIPGSATCMDAAKCAVCGGAMWASAPADPNAHNWGEPQYEFDKQGTNDEGIQEYTGTAQRWCTNRCGANQKETVNATYAITVEPTCTEEGEITYTAAFKAEWAETQITNQLATISALGHTEVTDEAVDPTCTETGLTEGAHCAVCGEVLTAQETVPALGHSKVTDEAVDPTCTETGLTEGAHCAICGEILTAQESVPALGHSYKTETIAPTCTEDGCITRTCTICGYSYVREVLPATLHWFDLWTPNENSTHSAPCRLCDHIGSAPCTLLEITDPADASNIRAVCPVCGKAGGDIFEVIEGAALTSATKRKLPTGEAIIRGMEAPFDGVLYAFTAAYEYSGEVVPFGTTVSVSIPLSAEQFPSFELVRVDVTPADETTERTEVRTPVEFTFEEDILTFEADAAALYLILAK